MFWQDLDPGYYQNPSAYTYLVYVLFRGDVRPARLPVRPAVRQRHRPVRQGPDGDVDRGPRARRGAMHGGRRGHLLGRTPVLGRARGAGGRRAARLRVPAGGLLARRGHGRGRARSACRSRSALPSGRTRTDACAFFAAAGAAAGLALAFKYTAGLALAAAGDRRVRAHPCRPRSRARRPGARRLAWPGSCSWRSTPTCSARSTPGGTTCATRPRWPRTTRSRVRSRAASPTTSTASRGVSDGPRRSPHCSAPRSSCGAVSCAG